MKLKVLKEFFDRKEDKYVYPSKTPTIEREGVRAAELISSGVAEVYVEGSVSDIPTAESVSETAESVSETAESVSETAESVDEQPEQEAPAEEKPTKKGGKK